MLGKILWSIAVATLIIWGGLSAAGRIMDLDQRVTALEAAHAPVEQGR